MKPLLNFLFLCLTTISFAQQITIEGITLDAENNTPLPYVNIGIMNSAVGTVSNSEGLFILKLPAKFDNEDKVTFSFIGYATQEHTIASLLKKQNRIVLQTKPAALEEMVITMKAPKPRKIGRTSIGLGLMHQNFYSANEADIDDRLSKEMGMKFNINGNCRVNDLNFNITTNEFASVVFRINFYKIEDGLPGELLFDENITCEVKDGQLGWFTADLKPYELYLPKELKQVAVTIQWLESKKSYDTGRFFALSTAMSPLDSSYYREKGMDTWRSGSSSLSFYLNVMKN